MGKLSEEFINWFLSFPVLEICKLMWFLREYLIDKVTWYS